MATLHAVLNQDSREIFQHLGSNEFLAFTAMNRWFYHHPHVVAIKVSYFLGIARRLIMLIERLQSLLRVYGFHV